MVELAGPQGETDKEYPDLWAAVTGDIMAVDVIEQRGTVNRTVHIKHLLTNEESKYRALFPVAEQMYLIP